MSTFPGQDQYGEALGIARQDVLLTPDLVKSDDMFQQNKFDALSDYLCCVGNCGDTSDVVDLVAWSNANRLLTKADARRELAELSEDLLASKKTAEFSSFVEAAVAANLMTAARAKKAMDRVA